MGLGLIGGSLALAAQRNGLPALCWDSDAGTREQVADHGVRVTSDFSEVDMAVLALPMPYLIDGLADTLTGLRLPESATITDVGSLKQPVLEAMDRAGLSGRYVGGHPMAGNEQTGFAAASPDLFTGARWALCLNGDEPDLTRWLQVAGLITDIGAGVVAMTPAEHDTAMATISGLPHLLALALSVNAAQAGPLLATLAAGSFADLTRVAASDPRLLHAVIEDNEASLRMALRRLLDQLDRNWADLIREGSTAKAELSRRTRAGAQADGRLVVVSGAWQLLELGRVGAVIEAVDLSSGAVRYGLP
ncbi:MAG: prephenate dehydrogenase/arogenate dehydrogenase family protein [Geodermatophilaceae bacterium]|nr:prephenate dehydrogenase/arogenate dehydrogenase family protein [Geodermatophilaceae bacterium]